MKGTAAHPMESGSPEENNQGDKTGAEKGLQRSPDVDISNQTSQHKLASSNGVDLSREGSSGFDIFQRRAPQ